MATFRYFADIAGEAHQLTAIRHEGQHTRARDFTGALPSGERVPATRYIEIKRNPSRHDCDARCLNATGRTMRCECACGGKNHGRGAFVCEAPQPAFNLA